MANNQNTPDENAIDKLNANLSSAPEKIMRNRNLIIWCAGGVAAIACLVLLYIFFVRTPGLNKAMEAYNQVEITAAGNDSIAAAEYAKVADKYSNNPGKLAALSAAESYYNIGKYKEAVKYLESFKSDDKVLDANAKVLLGDCYVNLKQYDKALGSYNKAISEADNNEQIVPRVLLKEANIYNAQKKYQDALNCYERIQKEYPTFTPGNGLGIEAYVERAKAMLGK